MTPTTPSTAIAVPDPERLALASFLAGYRGLTRDAYALDLRQFVAWCELHSLKLFSVRRADIELYARALEEAGRARAIHYEHPLVVPHDGHAKQLPARCICTPHW